MTDIGMNRIEFNGLARQILASGEQCRFRVRGNSMQPLVKDGDRLVVHAITPEKLQPGNILLYETRTGRLLVHRLVGKIRTGDHVALKLQGDAMLFPDGLIEVNQVVGIVDRIERGRASWLLNTTWRRIQAFFGIPFLNTVKSVLQTIFTLKYNLSR